MTSDLLWTPSPQRKESANVTRFMRWIESRHRAIHLDRYEDLYRWSIENTEQFWEAVWDFCEVQAPVRGDTTLERSAQFQETAWFPNSHLNYAENLLRHCQSADHRDALVFWGEDRVKRRLSRGDLHSQVSRFSQALHQAGVQKGDRVAGYLPNLPETVVAMLAAASLGAIWSSVSPDFGAQGALDRLGQIEPKVLVCADGYWYGGKQLDSLERITEIAAGLPELRQVVVVSYTRSQFSLPNVPGAIHYADFLAPFDDAPISYEHVEFRHPLYILYSSGTTGVPKCIVHGHGGVLLQHLKEHALHTDLKPGDRIFYYTTCGWMMWNWLISALGVGATVLLYDGSPFAGDSRVLLDYAEQEHATHFGTSAKFIEALAKTGIKPNEHYSFAPLRAVLSTGSPLAPDSFDYVYQAIKADLQLSSISGGTDIVSCFVLGSPIRPVWRGEIQCRGLGMAVEVWREDGRPLEGEKGELVCVQPFPSMPVCFWNDPDGKKYRSAYFERFPGVWCHGDFCEITQHGGLVIHGRSDATLNPGGVRIGTAEIYRELEKLPETLESVVIGQDWPPSHPTDVRVILFVTLRDGVELNDRLRDKIRQTIRANTTPRHVPAKIISVAGVPRTKSGKIVELAVREVVHGRPVKNIDALANPEALEFFKDIPELQG